MSVVINTVTAGVSPTTSTTQSAVPSIIPSSGTVATNGTLTLTTALPFNYNNGAWVWLPAGAVVGGAAGLYWVVFSSTTVGAVKTLYADPAAGEFIPYIPEGSLTAAVGSNAAYTQTTGAALPIVSVKVTGGTMGKNGSARLSPVWNTANSATTKTLLTQFGGTTIQTSTTTTTAQYLPVASVIRNRGLTGQQFCIGSGNQTSGSTGSPTSKDTTTDQFVTFAGNLAAATDFIIMESFSVEVNPKN